MKVFHVPQMFALITKVQLFVMHGVKHSRICNCGGAGGGGWTVSAAKGRNGLQLPELFEVWVKTGQELG
jgi:glyoxylate carboligase